MKKIVQIGNKKIGGDNPTYIIAEIGSNHNQDIKIAKKMIDEAASAGVDAAKFQTFKAETLYSKKTPKFSKDKIEPFDLLKSIEMPREWHKELFAYTKKKGIDFLSSPFDFEAVDELDKIGSPAFKIASFEIVDHELLKHTAKKKKPIILSTGLANIGEIEEAIDVIRAEGNDDIILLHCASMYPSPIEIMNLKAIQTMACSFQIPIGLSDHTMGIHVSLAAVAMGAKVIEKHFTLDRSMAGPDHNFAIQPEELQKLVSDIRDIEKAMGSGIKDKSKNEQEMYEKARRSIIAATDIPKGTKITKNKLIIKRPGYGIKPKYIDIIVGREAKTDIKAEQWITWDMI